MCCTVAPRAVSRVRNTWDYAQQTWSILNSSAFGFSTPFYTTGSVDGKSVWIFFAIPSGWIRHLCNCCKIREGFEAPHMLQPPDEGPYWLHVYQRKQVAVYAVSPMCKSKVSWLWQNYRVKGAGQTISHLIIYFKMYHLNTFVQLCLN